METFNINVLIDKSINIMNYFNLNKDEYFDPMSVIINFCLIGYKQIGTKLSILNNNIYISEKSILQSSLRTLFKDKKIDIKLLYLSILYSCSILLSKNNKYVIKIFTKSLFGLYNLKKTYEGDYDIIISINNYISLISNTLNNGEIKREYNLLADMNDDKNKEIYNIKNMIFEKLDSVWSINKLKIISKLFDELDDNIENLEYVNNILNSINNILSAISLKIKDILIQIFKKN